MSLHMAVKYNNYKVARTLLRFEATNVNALKDKNLTPLHVAIGNKSIEMVELLLDCGANVNPKRYGGKTPLFLAVEYECLEIVRMLLNAGALIRKAYIRKTTIFDLAEKAGDNTMRSLLIHHAEQQLGSLDCPSSSYEKTRKDKGKKKIKKSLLFSLLNKDKTSEETRKKRTLLRVAVLKRNTKIFVKRDLRKRSSK